jgi:hypothetical protein
MRGYGRRTLALSVVVGLIGLVGPSSATAATQIGETFTPNLTDGNVTEIQSGSPASQYAAPVPGGVITSWSFQASASPPPQLKFKVARQVAGNDFRIVGEEGPHAPTAGVLNTYPAQIAVQAGDVIGLFFDGIGHGTRSASGYTIRYVGGDQPPGTTATFGGLSTGFQLDVSAILEPDADNDGFGDETQDACPADPALQEAPCDRIAPDTTITGQPKAKTKKKSATFSFTSSEAGSTFECSLNGAPFTSCTSPLTVKGKKGKNNFKVRATDSAGNVDPTPASVDWKVKKKKR